MPRATKRKRGAGDPGTAPTRGRPRRGPEPKETSAANDSAATSSTLNQLPTTTDDTRNIGTSIHDKEANKTKQQDKSEATIIIDNGISSGKKISQIDEGDKGNDHAEEESATKMALRTTSTQSGAIDVEKAAKIQNLLEHRKTLLRSVQMGRRAVQKRINEMIAKDPGISSQTDAQEIAAFVALMRNVNSMARKQQGSASEQQQPERRSSVSLRRGSSVGKRMSLLPGEESGLPSVPQPKTSQVGSTLRPDHIQKIVRDAPVTAQKQPKLPVSSSTLQQQQMHRKLPQRSQIVSSQHASTSVLEKSAGFNVPSKMAPVQPPPDPKSRIVCPETMALREKRDNIRKKLSSLVMQRQTTAMPSEKEDLRRSSLGSVSSVGLPSRIIASHLPSSPALHQPSQETKNNQRRTYRPWEGPGPAPTLPRRRKSHWDIVLEEMRWLATDFREERKWKRSQARVVCHAIAAAQAAPKSQPTRNDSEISALAKNVSSDVGDRNLNEIYSRKPFDSSSILELSKENEEAVREIARIISKRITKAVEANEENNFFLESSAEMHQEDCTTSVVRNESSANRRDGSPTDSLSGRTSVPMDGQKGVPGTNSVQREFEKFDKEEFLEKASRNIDEMLKLVGGKSTNSKISKALAKTHGMSLSDSEKRAVDGIEDYWNRMDAGAVLRGPISSGKTIATCSLLWRHCSFGAQLLICSEASIIRWMHELARFPSLSVYSFGWLSEKMDLGHAIDDLLPANHVFVCQYSAIKELSDCTLTKFKTIVIDCRHSTGFDASRSPTVMETHGNQSSQAYESAPLELKSTTWWSRLAGVFAKSEARRLLVEKLGSGDVLHFLNGLSNRKYIEILALRTGILVGTKTFLTSTFSLEKSILLWARHRVKSSPGSGTKFDRVKEILTNIAKHFYCFVETGKNLEVDVLSSSNSKSWEIRRCNMTSSQEIGYRKGCQQVRSHLCMDHMANEESTNNHCLFAKAILHLRRLCVHPDIHKILSTSLSRFSLLETRNIGSPSSYALYNYKLNPASNTSQPTFELARSILEGSSKLQNMLSILIKECGHRLMLEDVVKILPDFEKLDTSRHRSQQEIKKVVILASLPEVQLLASMLLDSVGMKHEILLRSTPINEAPELSELFSKIDKLAWTSSQLILSSFNGGKSHWKNDVNIVIGSPLSIAGDHCGLGAEQADMVISLDEDWSGRCELLIQALILRSQLCKESIGKTGCRLVKLVAKNTCEDFFLGADAESPNTDYRVEKWPWPLDIFGVFSVPETATREKLGEKIDKMWPSRPPGRDRFAFPGSNLFRGIGKNLEEVLFATSKLPHPLFLKKSQKFISNLENEGEVIPNQKLLESLVQSESFLSNYTFPENAHRVVKMLTPIVPPRQFPLAKDISTLFKLSFFPGQLYFECIGTDALLHDVGGDSKRERLVLPNVLDTSNIQNHPVTEEVEVELATETKEPVEAASSLLLYGQKAELASHQAAIQELLCKTRFNVFAASFTSSTNVPEIHDGNQGSEGLVYFPPLFPRLRECAILAKGDIESLRSRDGTGLKQNAVNRNLKREVCLPDSSLDSKRLRMSEVTENAEMKCSREPPFVTEDEATHSDAASVLMDLADDYGLAGMGAVPLPRDSALAAGSSSIETMNTVSHASSVYNEWIQSSPFCDVEELQAALLNDPVNSSRNSMILLVSKKRQRGYSNPSSFSAFSRPLTLDNSRSVQSQGIQLHSPQDAHRYRLLTMLRQSGTGTTMFESPAFRVASVRLRTKVSDRVAHQIWTSGASFDAGPGLPLLVSRQQVSPTPGYRGLFEVDRNLWTSIVKRLKNKEACTGGEATELSFAQRTALRRSLVAPCRVDFGPFHCGFLSPPSGMTAATPHRPRAGVSLPMGVKIAHSTKDLALSTWSEEEERNLQAAAEKFGMNWMLAARSLAGFQDITTCSQQESLRYKSPRAARTCRDHWQAMARKDPSLIVKVKQSESFLSKHSRISEGGDQGQRLPAVQSQESDSVVSSQKVFLLPKDNDLCGEKTKTEVLSKSSDAASPSENRRRNFQVFKAARAKRQDFVMNIPGIPSGSIPTMVASHASHDEAVSSSVSMSWAGVRPDMWPLQLLDAAEKQRQADIVTAASSPPLAISQTEQTSSAPSNRINDGGPPQPRPILPSSAMPPAPRTHSISKMAYPPPANLSNGPVVSSRSPLIRTNNGASGTAKQSSAPPPASSSTSVSNKSPSPPQAQATSTLVSKTKPQSSSESDNQERSEETDNEKKPPKKTT